MSDTLFVRALAETDAEVQGKFINEFYRLLKVASKGREGNQLCYIADYLDENGREFIKEMSEYTKISIESRAKHEIAVQELYRQQHELEKEIAQLVAAKKALDVSATDF